MMLKRSQLLGRNTIYNRRYKKKLLKRDTLKPLVDPTVIQLKRHPLNGKPLMVIKSQNCRDLTVPAVLGVRTGQQISEIYSKLSELREGTTVCCITEPKRGSEALTAPGCKGIYQGVVSGKLMVRIGRRLVKFSEDAICFKGSIAGAGAGIKPIVRAGTAHIIKKSKLKKYPRVSSHKMNVHESQTGGSNRKKRGAPTTISRNASPGSKTGNLAASRTGRRKR